MYALKRSVHLEKNNTTQQKNTIEKISAWEHPRAAASVALFELYRVFDIQKKERKENDCVCSTQANCITRLSRCFWVCLCMHLYALFWKEQRERAKRLKTKIFETLLKFALHSGKYFMVVLRLPHVCVCVYFSHHQNRPRAIQSFYSLMYKCHYPDSTTDATTKQCTMCYIFPKQQTNLHNFVIHWTIIINKQTNTVSFYFSRWLPVTTIIESPADSPSIQ